MNSKIFYQMDCLLIVSLIEISKKDYINFKEKKSIITKLLLIAIMTL